MKKIQLNSTEPEKPPEQLAREKIAEAIAAVNEACGSLSAAQNAMAWVEGGEAVEIYRELRDLVYDRVLPLTERLGEAKPTGISEH